MARIVILTALEKKERQIVLNHLDDVKVINHPQTGTDYFTGRFHSFEIFVGRTDQTNVNSAFETERAIAFLKPEFIFFLGVAGGLKDVGLGDIVIGQDVIGYEVGKSIAEDGIEKFKPRSKFGTSSYKLVRFAIDFSLSDEWNKLKSTIRNKNIEVLSGTIASGEKVNASSSSDLSIFLKQHASHALAIEMEGLGFLEVCKSYPSIPSLLLRGISDLVENKMSSDEKGSQEQAMVNLSSFLFGFLAVYEKELFHYSPRDLASANIFNNLAEITCKLYPEGVRMNKVWQRAGGDISLIALSNNAYTQWRDALELLENGGGGNITLESFIEVLKKDFPNNKYIQDLHQ